MVPQPYVVRSRARETADTWTLELVPSAGAPIEPEPGQFAMLTAYGVGEVPISLSGRGDAARSCTRSATSVRSRAELCRLRAAERSACAGRSGRPGRSTDATGRRRRRPRGRARARAAPTRRRGSARPTRDSYGRLLLLYGARTPGDLLYPEQLEAWREAGLDVHLTVDAGTRSWLDRVGFVSDAAGRT